MGLLKHLLSLVAVLFVGKAQGRKQEQLEQTERDNEAMQSELGASSSHLNDDDVAERLRSKYSRD